MDIERQAGLGREEVIGPKGASELMGVILFMFTGA